MAMAAVKVVMESSDQLIPLPHMSKPQPMICCAMLLTTLLFIIIYKDARKAGCAAV